MTTEQLDLVCTAGRNRRPQKTEAMREQAATVIAQRLIKHGLIDPPLDEVVRDIVKATEWGNASDGYQIARALERSCHWDCDMQLAEELDAFGAVLDRLYREAEKRWAADNPREPEFKEGDIVMWRGQPATVHEVHKYAPQYYEIRQDEMAPNSWYLVAFEDVSAGESQIMRSPSRSEG